MAATPIVNMHHTRLLNPSRYAGNQDDDTGESRDFERHNRGGESVRYRDRGGE